MMEQDPGKNQEKAESEVQPVKKAKKERRPIHNILGGDYLSKESVIGNLPFLIFIAMLALFYIANTYNTEKTVKEIEKTKNDLKELRFQYITTKATLMYYSKQTEIARRALKFGLKETTIPPYKIFYSNDSTQSIKK